MTSWNYIILSFILIFVSHSNSLFASEDVDKDNKKATNKPKESAIDRRIRLERETKDNPFVIRPHKPNYALIAYTKAPNEEPFEDQDIELDHVELKFQISVKVPIARELFGGSGYLFAAYTQQAHWQAFNSSDSSPFRDTNHEPEIFFTFLTNQSVLGMKNRLLSFGINHQSNGRSGSISRSWNRIFMEFVLERGDFYLSVKPWWRIPESEKDDPNDSSGDDNPDITDYMGNGEILGLYELGGHRLGFKLRNNLRSENRGAFQLDWSIPTGGLFKLYVQYFNGYGETLLDYNYHSNRIGVGVMLVDWI